MSLFPRNRTYWWNVTRKTRINGSLFPQVTASGKCDILPCLNRPRRIPLYSWSWIILFVSLLSHFWLIHLFYLHLLYQPYVGLCQATCVQSHQRQSTSAVAIATREVQVSAADYQTVPTVATGVSKPLCCRLTLTFTLTSENLSLYITLLL